MHKWLIALGVAFFQNLAGRVEKTRQFNNVVVQEEMSRRGDDAARSTARTVQLFVYDEETGHQGALRAHSVASRKQHLPRSVAR